MAFLLEFLNTWAEALIALIAGAIIGLTAADIDLMKRLPVAHRSFWTHGPVVPLFLGGLAYFLDLNWLYWASLGFLPAFALHCAYDMFPKRWVGIAKISFKPIPKRVSGRSSFYILASSVVLSLLGTVLLAPSGVGLVAVVTVVAMVGRKYIKKEKVSSPGLQKFITRHKRKKTPVLAWLANQLARFSDAPALLVYSLSAGLAWFLLTVARWLPLFAQLPTTPLGG
jgi:hypothetical protein